MTNAPHTSDEFNPLTTLDDFDNSNDFEYERRFYCRDFPVELRNENPPALIVQSYFVHEDNFALRVRLQSSRVTVTMTPDTDALHTVEKWRGSFSRAFVTVKGPAVGGTRYEAERPIDPSVGIELVLRGGVPIVKNRYSVWLGSDGWSVDVFGGDNYPLIVAEAERSGPVTNLEIPQFCTTEITDDTRFSNDALAHAAFSEWQESFEKELGANGPHFLQGFGHNRHMPHTS
ncbi:MAG: CYTH domain-containing protein [Bifidobacteriaceae bacterium]|jgi:CYTH domain-containing protein|nr:CYTH domain-containing protein [Bifidobacteriaceae bacterium]